MTTPVVSAPRRVQRPHSLDGWIWLGMRYSGILLIPLAWIHVAIQDVLVGVHRISLDYVAQRWAYLGWRLYDVALLAFAFAHGMNGLRQVVEDYVASGRTRRWVRWIIFFLWLAVSGLGVVAVIGGVR
jgi:succinate dehydrogenase / fumarate reductase membrane anchor subunit